MRPFYRLAYKLVESVTLGCWHVQVEGREHVPAGGCLIVANHASYLDPTTVAWATGRECHYMARSTLFKPPVMDWLLPICNVVPVDRERGELATMRLVIRMLQEGKCLIIFPEGTRTPDGALQAPQSGAALIACKARVPILPVHVYGTYEALSRKMKTPRYHPLRVVIGKPFIPPAAKGKEEYEAIARRMMTEIAALK